MSDLKPIPGYENLYSVTKEGKVYGHKFKKYKRPNTHTGGYLGVNLYKNGRQKRHSIHRLVMLSFKGHSSLQVNHLDGDKKNNNLNNLEYCTAKDNIRHSYATRLQVQRKGLDSPRCKLVEKDLEIVKCLRAFEWTQKDIAKVLDVHQTTVRNWLRRLKCL